MKMILRKCLALAMIVLVGCDSNNAPEGMDSRIYEIGVQALEMTDSFLSGDRSIQATRNEFSEQNFTITINNILLEGGNRQEDHSIIDLNVGWGIMDIEQELRDVSRIRFADFYIDFLEDDLSRLDSLLGVRNDFAEMLGKETIASLQ